jgi:hypothetical protein
VLAPVAGPLPATLDDLSEDDVDSLLRELLAQEERS